MGTNFTDYNANNKVRLRRNAQRLKKADLSNNLPANSVELTQLQTITTDRILGRDTAGTGNIEQLTVSGGVEFTTSGGIQTSAFTGDATKAAGGTALTLATVNSNVGTFNTVTVNGKGLVTAASNTAYLTATNFVFHETPSGTINGVNTVFTLANTPTTGTEQVFLNRALQVPGTDYTISGATITFTGAPAGGAILRAHYLK